MRKTLIPALIVASAALTGCTELDEGINAHNVRGTAIIPKTVVTSAGGIGVVYVGLYSGVDNHLGFPSPKVAPAASSAGADAFPYGGTSLGTFFTRDERYRCQRVANQNVRDAGANWELDFEILQFPFYEGTSVYAFADRNNSSCNIGDGYYDYWQVRIIPLTVTADGTNWAIQLAPEEGINPPGGTTHFLDAAGKRWGVADYDDDTDILTVWDLFSVGGKPAVDGPLEPFMINESSTSEWPDYYGTQFHNVLNFPGDYIDPGDVVSSTPFVMNDLGKIEITVDYVVEP